MAHFVLVRDPDRERRSRYLQEITPLLHTVPGLREGATDLGPYRMVWVVGSHAPVGVASPGGAAVIGEIITERGPARGDAARELVTSPGGDQRIGRLDGFHLALTFTSSTLTVGTDVLGLFPVYYWDAGEVQLVASSPESIRRHPAFTLELDGRGLAGILLFNGLLGGRTLAHGVRRLGPGCALVAGAGTLREELRYRPTARPGLLSLPLDRQVEVVDHLLRDVFRRHYPADEPLAFMMSGGMDSRMIAGYLGGRGDRIHAITTGRADDTEMQCARRVAAALGFRHTGVERVHEDPGEEARVTARTEWLASGFSGAGGYHAEPPVPDLPTRRVSGHVLDYVITTTHGDWPWVVGEPWPRWQDLFTLCNTWGLAPETVRAVVRPAVLGDGLEAALRDAEKEFASYSADGPERLRYFELYNRGRWHVGGGIWRQSFRAWPALPVLDRAFLDTAWGFPLATTDLNRRLQRQILLDKFPTIGRMPLDKNLRETMLLAPTTRQLVARGVKRRLASLWRRVAPTRERRQYYRSYDFNNARWRAIRAAAESFRPRAGAVFDLDALGHVLPGPEVAVHRDDPIAGVAGLKMLVGLLLWLEETGT